MKVEEVICDQCGVRKGKENGWCRVDSGIDFFKVLLPSVIVTGNRGEIKDMCSDNCIMIALSEFLHPKKANDFVDAIMQDLERKLPQ